MENIQVDDSGALRCSSCGGRHFSEKRTRQAKVIGGAAGVATLGIVGAAGALVTKKKLYCQACGTYNRMGNAEPYRPKAASPPAASASPHQREVDPVSDATGSLMLMVGITVALVIGLVVAISNGAWGWVVLSGLTAVFTAFLTLGAWSNVETARRSLGPPTASKQPEIAASTPPPVVRPRAAISEPRRSFEVKKKHTRNPARPSR